MGVAIHVVAPEVHRFEQVADDFSPLFSRGHTILVERVFERTENRKGGIELGMRVLKHDLQSFAKWHQLIIRRVA